MRDLIWAIRHEQERAQPDFERLETVSIAALRDILSAKKAHLDVSSQAVLRFLQFDLSILPMGLATSRKRLEPVFVWIARSLVDQVEIGNSVEIRPIRFAEVTNPKQPLTVSPYVLGTSLEWIRLLYYYSRKTGGHGPLAEQLYQAALYLTGNNLNEDSALIAVVDVLTWAINTGKDVPLPMVTAIRSTYLDHQCGDETHKLLGTWFAMQNIPGLNLDRAIEAKKVTDEHGDMLMFHEPLQLLAVVIGTDVQKARHKWPAVKGALLSYNEQLRREEPDELSRRYEKERLFSIISGLLLTLIKGSEFELAIELLALWEDFSGSALEKRLLLILPTTENGILYASSEGQLLTLSTKSVNSLRYLVSSIVLV